MGLASRRNPDMEPGRENAQRLAQEFLAASAALSRAIEKIDDMGRYLWPEIGQEEEAADRIVIEGPEIARAFRVMAMRLDRAALLNMPTKEN